jgi:hypothetical protein
MSCVFVTIDLGIADFGKSYRFVVCTSKKSILGEKTCKYRLRLPHDLAIASFRSCKDVLPGFQNTH